MNELVVFTQEGTDAKDNLLSLAERLDFLDIQILRKFYMTGRTPPLDTQPHCFPVLYLEMRVSKQISITSEALRKRLDKLVVLGLLEKIKRANPANYTPIEGLEEKIKVMIARFFIINGIAGFL